jgi:hypothetical protein
MREMRGGAGLYEREFEDRKSRSGCGRMPPWDRRLADSTNDHSKSMLHAPWTFCKTCNCTFMHCKLPTHTQSPNLLCVHPKLWEERQSGPHESPGCKSGQCALAWSYRLFLLATTTSTPRANEERLSKAQVTITHTF